MSLVRGYRPALFAVALVSLVAVACGGASSDDLSGDSPLPGEELDIKGQRIVTKCVSGERKFTVSKAGAKLEGRFKNFSVLSKKEEAYECVLHDKGTIHYRCFRDVGTRLVEQVNLMRTASNTPQTEFNLVNERNEQGGGDFLFSFACEAGSKLDF